MKRKYIGLLLVAMLLCGNVQAQFSRGTTGLINMPTADMQRDKTFLAGGSWLDSHGTVPRWWYDTFNYYINITMFPWLEVGYTMTGFKAVPYDYGGGKSRWVPRNYGHFVNQDRSFHVRLRLWKEGWWKEWTPQVVFGANEAVGESHKGGSLTGVQEQGTGNGFWARYYLAFTKHFEFKNIGTLGAHVAWLYSERFDNELNDPAVGVNFRFGLPENGKWWRKAVNGIDLMAELVPGYTDVDENLYFDPNGPKWQVNVGMNYAIWKDYATGILALNRCRYVSVGVQFKVHLK